ncbi:UDP-N-acetylmuramoyl-tripeptide--D-alanyl-D-alanine ligase [Saccharicrinis sp. FJH62]|uniref:UDP-N-acetylmuramoyl-tripeptide--D-alanyl-D- alanine ligase n=1 Tax=Saccharicrinis sp. FJH62 TaxID=3344657 RepID=UPI0035D43EA7
MINPGIETLYNLYSTNPVITTDSRDCPRGSIFFALKGDNFNGNCFALNALENGCSIAVIDEEEFYIEDGRHILVSNVLVSLQKLANFHRRKFTIPVIGITGTNGKTTTKELISSVLSQKFNTHFTKGNFNNHIGVPLTLLQLTSKHEMAIIEMGANHPGEIGELSKIAEPDYGIITNIGKAHLEGFGSYEIVIRTKNELFGFIRSKHGKLFVNQTNELLMRLSEGIERILYGMEKVKVNPEQSSPLLELIYKKSESNEIVRTNLIGKYNLENIQAAVCIGIFFGVSDDKIINAIKNYQPTNNRSQVLKTQKNTLILDMYNANPTSMAAAITEFQSSGFSNKVAIIGDMKELGEFAEKEHKTILNLFERKLFSRLICIGEVFTKFNDKYPQIEFYPTTEVALEQIALKPITNSYILLKGSRSMKLEILLTEL